MSVFEPRTFSTDWEVMVVDRLDRPVDTAKCDALGGVLANELDLPIHMDWCTIEFGLGVNHSFSEFLDRTIRATDRAAEVVREYDLDLYPVAAHPLTPFFNASHFHVGTIHDETVGIRLENQIMPYVAAFAALAANSPAWFRRRGEYKSYRVRHLAHGCTEPSTVRDPHTAQLVWGGDAGPKIYGKPTMEVRIIDCASSRRLLAEMAVFTAAFLHQMGEKVEDAPPDRERYRELLTNRWAAAKHGLQATFLWNGATRSVVEILGEMLRFCAPALKHLGAKRSDLGLINTMLRKRVCQADYVNDIARRYPDPHLLTSVTAKLLRHWDVFDEYVGKARAMEPVAAPTEDDILRAHLEYVGEGTHHFRLREVMRYPGPVADGLIERMVENGLVTREVSATRGTVLHRNA